MLSRRRREPEEAPVKPAAKRPWHAPQLVLLLSDGIEGFGNNAAAMGDEYQSPCYSTCTKMGANQENASKCTSHNGGIAAPS